MPHMYWIKSPGDERLMQVFCKASRAVLPWLISPSFTEKTFTAR